MTEQLEYLQKEISQKNNELLLTGNELESEKVSLILLFKKIVCYYEMNLLLSLTSNYVTVEDCDCLFKSFINI